MRTSVVALLLILCSCGQPNRTNEVDEPVVKESTDSKNEEIATAVHAPIPEEEVDDFSEEVSVEEFENVDWNEYEASLTKDFSFVILISTRDYNAALKRAKDASEKLGYPMNLRELHPNKESGLSLPREVCEEDICGGGLDYPIYLPRNDWGDSKYVSVEYSDGFKGFTKGYYIVVVASGEKGDPVIEEALTASRKFYKDAYAKTCGVWMGCGC